MKILKFAITTFLSVVLLSGCSWMNYEKYTNVQTEIQQPITIDKQTLNGYLAASIPFAGDSIADMVLILVSGELSVQDNVVSLSGLSFVYYRYIDDSREGGNIQEIRINVDPVDDVLVSITEFAGAGKASPTTGDAINDSSGYMSLTPDELYQQFLLSDSALDISAEQTLKFNIRGSRLDWTVVV